MKFKVYSCVTVSDITDNSIASVDVMYYLSTSNTECIGGTWSTTPPPWENGKYYWQKTVTTFTDTSIQPSETQPVCITGGKGQDGRGVQSITEEYYLSTSKEEPIGGEWTTTQPQWTKGKYIWTRSKIVYTNPTGTEYTEAYCDSSWEVIDKIEIGGKNLLLNTSSMIEYDEEICNWSLDNNGQVSINETDAATDSRHIKTSNASDANSGLKSVITGIDFKQGENYTFSCAIRGTCDESRLFGCQIYYRNEDGISTYDSNSRTLWTDNGDDINDGISAANFQRRYCTFTIPDDYDENTNLLAINIYCTTMDIYVRNFQLERGNVATDWKMADEDIQSQIQSVTSTISGVSSKVNQIEQNITDKVWITDINDYINDYDQSTVQVISDKLTEQIQDVDGIKSTVSSMQTTLETKADGSTVTELTNRVSQAQQDITGFKQTVEETYATKDENNSVRTYAEQLADKFNWVVTSNSSSTSLTLTDNMVSAITDQFVINSPDGKRVVIEDGILKSDFLQSLNYQAGTGTPKYANTGTMFDMTNGAIYSKNFVISSSGEAYFKGTVYASAGSFTGNVNATSGTIGGCNIQNGTLTVPFANVTGTLEANQIAANTITSTMISANAITSAKINAGAITTDKLASHSVTTDKLTTENISGTNGWINFSDGTFNYGNGKLSWDGSNLNINGNGTFTGTINATSGNFVGNITANTITATQSGKIACWNINSSSIYNGNSSFGNANGMYFGTSGLSLGSAFKVTKAGALTASGVNITGNITATSITAYQTYGISFNKCDNNGKPTSTYLSNDNILFGYSYPVEPGYPDKYTYHRLVVLQSPEYESKKASIKLLTSKLEESSTYAEIALDCQMTSTTGDLYVGLKDSFGGDATGSVYAKYVGASTIDADRIQFIGNLPPDVHHIELRASGGSPSQSLSFVLYDNNNQAKYFNSVMTPNGQMISAGGYMCGGVVDKFANNVLWSGAIWPTSEQSCTLSSPITDMPHGILIIFSNYSGSIQNTRIHCFYVPKKAISQWSGSGFQFNMFSTDFSQVCGKYLYIANSKITGHNDNTKTGTGSSGIKYANNTFALRAVVGV